MRRRSSPAAPGWTWLLGVLVAAVLTGGVAPVVAGIAADGTITAVVNGPLTSSR